MPSGRVPAEFNRPQEAEGLLTTNEMCKEWKCATYFLNRCVAEGMPRKIIGGSYFYNLKECQEWYATSEPEEKINKPRKPEETAGLLTFSQMCETWQIDRKTLYKYMKQGMPHTQVNKKNFFNLAECQKWSRGEI